MFAESCNAPRKCCTATGSQIGCWANAVGTTVFSVASKDETSRRASVHITRLITLQSVLYRHVLYSLSIVRVPYATSLEYTWTGHWRASEKCFTLWQEKQIAPIIRLSRNYRMTYTVIMRSNSPLFCRPQERRGYSSV